MSADFRDTPPIFRVSPPPPEPAPQKPAFDPTAEPVWGPVFSQMREDPRGYRVRSEEVWLKARDAYLGGFSAETVCAEFDLGLSAFRQRARREGWRRADAQAAEPEPLGFPAEPDAAMATSELADLAWRSAAQAIRRGRVYEARAWIRLVDELKAMIRNDRIEAYAAARKAEAEAAALVSQGEAENDDDAQLHPLHGEDGVQSAAGAGPLSQANVDALIRIIEATADEDGDLKEATRRIKQVRDAVAALNGPKPP